MRKSLLVTLYFPPTRGGISNSLWNVCRHIPKGKIVVLTQETDVLHRSNCPIYRKKLLSKSRLIWPKWLFMIREINTIVREQSIDLIQAGQTLPIGFVALLFKKFKGLPYFVYVYGQDMILMRKSWRKMFLIKMILKNADGVIANSEFTKNIATSLGASEKRTIILYPSPHDQIETQVDQQYLDYTINRRGIAGKKILLSVGNIVERKGQDIIIKALPHVIKEVPDILYAIVGTGPYKEQLINLAISLNVQNFIKYFDDVSDEELPYFYRSCRVLTMVSRDLKNSEGKSIDVEGFGMVYLEANLFGKPVIGGNSGGVPEAIEHGVSGLVVDPNSEIEVADAIIKLLTDAAYAKKLGEQGRIRAREKFKWSNEVEKLMKLLK